MHALHLHSLVQLFEPGHKSGLRNPLCRPNGSRLGVPALVHEECLTGFTTYGATVYPASIAWGAGAGPTPDGRSTTTVAPSASHPEPSRPLKTRPSSAEDEV